MVEPWKFAHCFLCSRASDAPTARTWMVEGLQRIFQDTLVLECLG